MSGQRILVTGASRGIGRAIAICFAKKGAKVAFTYASRESQAQETATLLKEAGAADVWYMQVDVSREEQVEKLATDLTAKWGGVDVLVNNAGINIDALFLRLKSDDWDKLMAVNLKGAMLVSREFIKPMMKQRDGSIIMISSVVGEMGNAGQAAYAASKAGLLGLAKSMAREFASRNIRVNVITPGYIETEMTGGLTEDAKAKLLAGIALGRIGKGEEVGALAVFLGSQDAQYITGQVIGINGGLYL
jgi:3-oxoacyl-[acyl-carrier protein] reductase